jgi:CDP-glucose 4,6-dehydratase
MTSNEVNPQFWKNKKVLITGHTGFKGGWLTFWLFHLGAKVTGCSLEPTTEPNLFNALKLDELCDHHICDIRDLDALKKLFEKTKPDVVFHLAAQPLVLESYDIPVETYATNVMGTVNLLEACRLLDYPIQSVVISTTDKVYENISQVKGYRENDRLGGRDPYSNSKACTELVISSYRDSFFSPSNPHSKPTLIISARAGNVFGGGDWSKNRIIPDCAVSFSKNEPVILRNPESVRPWQFVSEPLRGYLLLAQQDPEVRTNKQISQAWNFGPKDEDCLPVKKLAEIMRDSWGGDASVTIVQNPTALHEEVFLKLDSGYANSHLKWVRKVNTVDGLKMSAEWYKAFYQKVSVSKLREITLSQLNFVNI